MTDLSIARFRQELSAIQSLLETLVKIESPTTKKSAVDRLGAALARELTDLGGEVQVFPQDWSGDHIRCRWGQGAGGMLFLCHMDTVFDLGTLAQRPFKAEGDRLLGPGVMDMKSGIAMLVSVVRVLKQEGLWPDRPISLLLTSDEETGSLTSRALIETEASQAGVVFCLEPALANGAVKTSRKGTGDIELRVQGVAAHAGVDHAQGRNAIAELAYHILAAQQLTDYARGTTVNVGVVSGGTRGNVVPDEAHALIDFRVLEHAEFHRLEDWVRHLAPHIEGTRVTASIELNRPPMPRDETMAHTFHKAQAIARQVGLELREGSTGGGSDANFVAPLGIPVLDGLGAVGDGAHSEREFILTASLAERSALLAALILNW